MTDPLADYENSLREVHDYQDAIERAGKDHPLKGRRVRVVRVYVFEGTTEDMMRQLGNSIPAGTTKEFRSSGTIRVHEEPWEDLGPVT